ncbi:MAG: ATP-binding protein [Elusimicrobiota bacterium]|nr:ATP-binding protein [Elusimicrobiota bacterium]
MIISRNLKSELVRLAKKYPVVTLTGPRQSGKTTLCKIAFPKKEYLSMENLDIRRFAQNDPNAFLKQFPRGAILDEIQRAPDLLSYIQTIVDEKKHAEGMFILTGSRQFEFMDSINQSLAGRSAITRLLPFSFSEIYPKKLPAIDKILYTGFYPRIFDKKLNPTETMSFYTTTYLERDVRSLLNIKDLSKFELFLKLCASRTGQILNLSNLGNECGINHNTAKNWLSVLEASYIVFLLKPYHKNFKKRLIKSPKLYFIDTGLAAFLLGIQSPQHLNTHPLKGALFETFIISEFLKARFNKVKTNNLYYFRDSLGTEIDLILDYGDITVPVEIKSGQTIANDYFKNLRYYSKLRGNKTGKAMLIYGGNLSYKEGKINIVGITNFSDLLKNIE